ncbi:ArgE/DapE family deacylase [Paenibacillus albus]|uniref:Probable succinyl-diaminopimelate desuccinylase n=1 Tax=Paenibacillus albus TaxID=2495582 RepID=A0A3S9A773_9BACL|nr:ArgE/DapE family deacylase [Paenibacillus albus]AZN41563.1 ArgE/DapE family deacylase [Paenibacillus albus]
MNTNKQRILEWIDSQEDHLIQFLKELIRIPSDNPPGDCHKIAEYVHSSLQNFGFLESSLLEVDEESVVKSGMIRTANVLATTEFGAGAGPHVALNAHGDVVAPGLGWTYGPYGGEIVDGKMYGRGAAVSKSDIAAYTFAVLALKQFDEHLSGKTTLVFNFDEETGGENGPKWLLERGYIKPDLVISAGFTYSIVNSHNGCLHLEIKARGKSAHAAAPQSGVDAIEAMTGIMTALYEYRNSLHTIRSNVPGIESPTLNIGLISGGINTNVVPDYCSIRIDRRLIPEEDGEIAQQDILRLIQRQVEQCPGIQVEVERVLYARSLQPSAGQATLVEAIQRNWNHVLNGNTPAVHGVPLYTDARHFAEAGLPVVMFGAGPRTLVEANGHRADEHVRIDDLMSATKIIAATLYDLLLLRN